jgi:Right handed beta helix region
MRYVVHRCLGFADERGVLMKQCLALLFLLVASAACTRANNPEEVLPDDALASEAVQELLYVSSNGAGTDCTATRPCTLAQARLKVRTLNDTMTGHIVVRLKAGTYTLSNTLALNAADSGSNGYYVIYQAEPNATVRFSGGGQLTNWTSAGNGIYKTNVGSLRFRSLFVNGTPALRSREPDGSYYRLKNWNLANKTLAINPPEISRWARFNQVEMVIQKHWNQDRLRLQDYRVVNLGSSINVAAGAVSYTSSSYDGNTVSSKGNDDNIATLYASGANDGGTYWQVDLGVAYPLKRIELVTRQDDDYEWSRRNFEVWASNNADMSLGHVVLGTQGSTPLPYKATFNINVTDVTPYRYVAVVGTSGALAFAELRAFKTTTGNEQSVLITPQSPERERSFNLSHPPKEPNQVYHFENALEFLDTPGEFYLNTDTNEVFYKPRAGENLATAQVIAPKLETLVSIDGAKYVRFERMIFEHADWLKPSSEGFVGIQASAFNGGYLSAGVIVKNAQSIHFVRSTFQDMGASGLNVYSNVQTALVLGCRFEDLGGQGVALDAAIDTVSTGANVKNSSIKNNYITRIGQQYPGSVGIFTGFTEAISIEHNALWDLPYSAISAGWGWSQNETRSKRNIIRYNHIWNVVNKHDDGGGIYTLSNQAGTLIAENYIHDLKVSPWAGTYPIVGVYLDEGSSNITVKDNVLQNIPDNFLIKQNRPGPNNTLINNEGNSQAVKDKAGPEPGY